MNFLRFLRLIAVAASFSVVPDNVLAQDDVLEEMRVTATRRPAAVTDITAAVAVVSGEDSIDKMLTTDLLAATPGVTLQQTTPGQGVAIVRGLKGSSVLHLVDGMRLSNAIFRSAPTPYFAFVPTMAVDRIEVIRGTPASLYGSEAVGGVVQLVSRLPEFDNEENSLWRDVAVGLDSANLQRSIRGTIDFGNRALAVSLSASYLETGDRQVGGGDRVTPSGFESRSLRGVVYARPENERRWLFDLHYLEQPETPRVDELVPGFGQTEPSSEEFFFSPSARTFAHFRYEKDMGWLDADWRFDTAWQRIDDDRSNRDLGSDERRLEGNRSDLFGMTLTASGGKRRGWIAGADFYYDEVSSERFSQDVASGALTEVASRFPDGSRLTQSAIFASTDWQVSSRNALTGGLRFSGSSIDLPAAFGGENIDISRLSGDLGWIFDIDDRWQLVANVGAGFRAPNIFDLGTLGNRPGNRFNIPNTNLDVEEALHSDIGVRFRGDMVDFDLVVYSLQYDDRITSVGTGDVTPDGRDVVQSVNAADARFHGAELGFNVTFSDTLRIESLLNYAWGEQEIETRIEPADRVPPLNGRVSFYLDTSDRLSWSAHIEGATRQDRLAARDIRDVRIDPNGTPGWLIASVGANWRNEQGWRIAATVENLLDKRFRQHGSGIDSAGRNVSLTLRRSW